MSFKIPALILTSTILAFAYFLHTEEPAQTIPQEEENSTVALKSEALTVVTEEAASAGIIIEEDIIQEQELSEIILDVPLLTKSPKINQPTR